MPSLNPILNNPYEEPREHYATDSDGSLNYEDARKGRRIFTPDVQVMPNKQGPQKSAFEINDFSEQFENHIINLSRKEIGAWRKAQYPNTTRVTRELLHFWFLNPERHAVKKLFFAQQEAIETAVWLNEVAGQSNAGQNILAMLQEAQKSVGSNPEDQLPRIAFKMATGSGKTVVMACLILYHYFNRQEYRNDTRFADYFLIVAPGITIKDRLNVLMVDPAINSEDYYHQRGLVPQNLQHRLENLNARLVITNYHTFEPRTLQGNKKSPFDGKVDLQGKKIDTDNKEDFSQVVKRTLSKFRTGRRLLVLNDEAHHCYLPLTTGKTKDNEEDDENERAAVWFRGVKEISKKFTLQSVYDLSATPYYLQGSGYTPYSLFPWVVSDFGLIEAIESGLVKIPFLPESDNTHELSMPMLRNLYDHVRDDLPKKGQRKKKADDKAEGKEVSEPGPQLPRLIHAAMDQFYKHYHDYFNSLKEAQQKRDRNLFDAPPVFIIVCNNTSVSKEVYKYIAGYEYTTDQGEVVTVQGAKELFSNYDYNGKPLRRPPTLLIDSYALENSGQVNDEFKKIFASEIAEFKKDYARQHGHGSVENITDGEILREVVNTVGRPGKLGAYVRCVVSVSMLTEGWDANTVTHIMGIRAFGSQLLCEQVAGRALRRRDYHLQGYDKENNPTTDKRKIAIEKFPPEYAHIIGVPFKMFKGGETPPPEPPPNATHIFSLEERDDLEITFPNIVGYKMENHDGEILHDFSGIENYKIDTTKLPIVTVTGTAVSSETQKLEVQDVFEKRDQEVIFCLTKELLKVHFSDDDQQPKFQLFNKLKNIVQEWYDTKVTLLNATDQRFKRLLAFENPKTVVDHIARGINPHINTKEHIRPVFNYYNKFGSTKHVNGSTTKEVYPTKKSHVNYVVADTESWEQICAKTLEELADEGHVASFVKNAFLGFAIPYVKDGKDHQYSPDFIARVKGKDGGFKSLVIEISGMSKDKEEKTWFVRNRWLPAVNAMREKFDYDEWDFIEIAESVSNIKTDLLEKIASMN